MQHEVTKVFDSASVLNKAKYTCSAQTKERWSMPSNPEAAQKALEITLKVLWLPAFDCDIARTYAAEYDYRFAPGSYGDVGDTAALYDRAKGLFDYFEGGIMRATAKDKIRTRACQSIALSALINSVCIEMLVKLPYINHRVKIDGLDW